MTDDRMATSSAPGPEDPEDTAGAGIDTTVPHSARIWNYWLGGKDNYAVDREAGDPYVKIYPGIVDIARANRAFLARAVRYLALEAGIRQFLDVGPGLPTVDNTHELAQRAVPASRIVYVDNDPLVLACPRPADQHPGGRHRLHRCRYAGPGSDTGAGGDNAEPRPAGRADADGCHGAYHR